MLSSGVVTLIKDFDVCKEGDTLTPEQARILVSDFLFLPAVSLEDNWNSHIDKKRFLSTNYEVDLC